MDKVDIVIFLNENNRVNRPTKTMLNISQLKLYQFMHLISLDIKYKIHFIS